MRAAHAGPTAPRRPHGPTPAPRPHAGPTALVHAGARTIPARPIPHGQRPKHRPDRPENSAKPQVTELDCMPAMEVPPCSQYHRTPRKGTEMANPANYAISLGLLIAVLAAILAATKRTPAMAGAAGPLLAAANGRQPTRRTGTGRTARKGTGKANGTGKPNGNGKATRADNGQTPTATPPRTPRRAKADTTSASPTVNPISGTERLQPGKLQEQVLAYLTGHAGEELSPSQIAKALGRSSGAVGNGLESLAKDGEVQKTRQTPRRFMIPASGTAKRNGTGRRNGTSQAAAPAAPKATRTTRGTRKAGNGPNATAGTGKGNGGNGPKAEPPATPAPSQPTAKPTGRKPATRRGRNGKAGAAADEAAATGT